MKALKTVAFVFFIVFQGKPNEKFLKVFDPCRLYFQRYLSLLNKMKLTEKKKTGFFLFKSITVLPRPSATFGVLNHDKVNSSL